jgi:hypothetical protein
MKRTLFSSNPMPRRILAAVCGAALLAGSSLGALAQSVGVHFGNAGGTGYATNSSTDLLLPTDSAGVPDYAQTNWNDLGASGDSGGVNGTPVVLTNSAGAATSLSIMWSSAGVGSTGTGSGLGTPDGNLMDGYLYSYSPGAATPLGNSVYYNSPTNNPLAYVGGLNAWCQAQGAVGYNVVLYTTGNSYWETVEGYLESVTGSPFSFSMVEGSVLTPPLYEQDSANYSGTYVPVTSTNSSSPTAGGNCMVFSGMTNDAVLIRVQTSGYGAGLNGFQIMPIPGPTTSVVTLSSMVSGSSMTLSWPQGTLQTATNLLGPWTSSSATSPYTDTMTNAAQFYRVQVR